MTHGKFEFQRNRTRLFMRRVRMAICLVTTSLLIGIGTHYTWADTQEPVEKLQVKRLDLKTDKVSVGPKKEEVFLVKDERLINKGLEILQRLVDSLPGKPSRVVDTWWFGVVEGDNAYGVEFERGGYVVVGQKVLEDHPSDEIAFVIAHEVAHVLLQHREMPSLGMKPIEPVPLIPFLYEKQLSKEQELAADDWAITYMQYACFDTEGAVRYLETQIKKEGQVAGTIKRVLSFLLPHPPHLRDLLL